jgi:hypothetical protein
VELLDLAAQTAADLSALGGTPLQHRQELCRKVAWIAHMEEQLIGVAAENL